MPQWTLLTRDGCTLCDEFMDDLAAILGPDEVSRVQLVDVDADPEIRRKYGTRIPVLLADGDMVCHYHADGERIRPYLTTGSGTAS